ncbi:MAG: hypothetical protein HDT23_02605 [Ruminococcus sp.]|nr:hypothetical protein [Ruminococcus sp.]
MNEKLKNMSVEGRIKFTILCIEKYLSMKYPSKDWKPLFSVMEKLNNTYWDESLYSFTDIMPECIVKTSYRPDYDIFMELYNDTENDVSELLESLEMIVELFIYTSMYDFNNNESVKIIENIINKYFIENNISIPEL